MHRIVENSVIHQLLLSSQNKDNKNESNSIIKDHTGVVDYMYVYVNTNFREYTGQ